MSGQRSSRYAQLTLLALSVGLLLAGVTAHSAPAAPGPGAPAMPAPAMPAPAMPAPAMPAPAMPAPAAAAPSEAEIAKLVAQLGDDDYDTREQAGERLRRIGIVARPALAAAAAGRDPEVIHRARQLLENLSWTEPTDAEPIRELLTAYNQALPLTRQNLVVRLVRLSDRLGWEAVLPVLLRIVRYEDNDSVRTEALRLLMAHDQPTLRAELARRVPDPPTTVVDTLLRAILLRDRPSEAVAVLDRGVDRERARQKAAPNADAGLLVLLLERRWTSRRATVLLGQVDDATKANAAVEADLAELAGQLSSGDAGRAALQRLLAWQVGRADWVGLERSVGRFSDRLNGDPFALVWLAIGLSSQGKPKDAAGRLEQADKLVAAEPEHRMALAEHLLTLSQAAWAESRLRTLAAEPPRNDVYDLKLNAQLRLADLYESTGQPAKAVVELEAVAKLLLDRSAETLGRYYFKTAGSPAALRARLELARYQEATTAKPPDAAAVRRRLSALRTIAFHDAAAAIVAVSALRAAGQAADADKLIDEVRTHCRQMHQRDPDPAHLNSLAWVLARTGSQLDAALEAAESAIRAAPDRSAYWDTLAEVHAAAGRRPAAISAALRALELDPFEPSLQARLPALRAPPR